MYCKNCGNEMEEAASFCSHCGTRLDGNANQSVSKDRSHLAFGFLCFFIPILGLIFFLVFEKKNPKRARACGVGALIGFISLLVWVFGSVLLDMLFYR